MWKAKLLWFGAKIVLLKSVLTSIPLYSLDAIKVPKVVITRIEKAMANFLWDSAGEKRAHWVSWAIVCRPLDEGGIGIRSLSQVMDSLHTKLAWSARQGSSLLARYATAKYGSAFGFSTPVVSSPVWRAVMTQMPRVNLCSRWVLGRGSVGFWTENWCGEALHGPTSIDVLAC